MHVAIRTQGARGLYRVCQTPRREPNTPRLLGLTLETPAASWHVTQGQANLASCRDRSPDQASLSIQVFGNGAELAPRDVRQPLTRPRLRTLSAAGAADSCKQEPMQGSGAAHSCTTSARYVQFVLLRCRNMRQDVPRLGESRLHRTCTGSDPRPGVTTNQI